MTTTFSNIFQHFPIFSEKFLTFSDAISTINNSTSTISVAIPRFYNTVWLTLAFNDILQHFMTFYVILQHFYNILRQNLRRNKVYWFPPFFRINDVKDFAALQSMCATKDSQQFIKLVTTLTSQLTQPCSLSETVSGRLILTTWLSGAEDLNFPPR